MGYVVCFYTTGSLYYAKAYKPFLLIRRTPLIYYMSILEECKI